mmetsp:Transcript_16906/g.53454  ORF Transcript_16906/g.53454 Transcript_16906/m.53454 type:complete len:221 (-) Transcript_16906:678-1340(-)
MQGPQLGRMVSPFFLARRDQRVGAADLAGAAGASDAVDVRFGRLRAVDVDHRGDTFDVEAALRHVRRHQQRVLRRTELLQHPVALLLRLVAVQREGRPSVEPQLLCQLVAAPLGRREEQHARAIDYLFEQREQRLHLARVIAEQHALLDGQVGPAGGGERSTNLHYDVRRRDEPPRQRLHFGRPRCGEEQALPVVPHVAEDCRDLRLETEVEHPIRLVEC